MTFLNSYLKPAQILTPILSQIFYLNLFFYGGVPLKRNWMSFGSVARILTNKEGIEMAFQINYFNVI